ncbi:MAG: hypothetical protein LBK60_02240 [Verrucomicrobiales bacterium]|jgi:hypothetical protein|nr:hypothetical protein [Verrucomicrobiales bacterium]
MHVHINLVFYRWIAYAGNMAIKMTRKLSLGTFGISFLLHATLFFMVSGWVLIQSVTPKLVPVAADGGYETQTPVEAPPEMPEDEIPALPNHDSTEVTDSTVVQTGMPTEVITAAGPGNFSLPPSVGVYVPGAAVNTMPAPGTGEARSADAVKKIAVGQIFGTQVEAGKLGVIIDYSGSARPFLGKVYADIERSFKDAVIVLTHGCGIKDPAGTNIKVSVEKFTKGRLAQRMQFYVDRSIQRKDGAEKMFEALLARKDVYYVNCNGSTKSISDIHMTHFAFAELFKRGVDTVYWFSDFMDAIDSAPAQKLLEEIKARNIRVYINNFTGLTANEGMKFARQLTRETGGTATVKKR